MVPRLVPRPRDREPNCIHSTGVNTVTQPASRCRICKDGPELAKWKADWVVWLAEYPDSWEAREVARWAAEGQGRRSSDED